MNVLVILIPASLILGGLGLLAFYWTVKSDQYDDVEGAAARILLDEEDEPED
jgi:cbb3-type cytochrome oxidase maturation protein